MDTNQPDREIVEFTNELMHEVCGVEAGINQQIMPSRDARANGTIVCEHGHGKDPLTWPWLSPTFVICVEYERIFLQMHIGLVKYDLQLLTQTGFAGARSAIQQNNRWNRGG